MSQAKVIVVGNEKGGAGKTTTAMHLIMGLVHLGFKVVSIDADVRQASLTKYIKNRLQTATDLNITLSLPTHYEIQQEKSHTDQFMAILSKEIGQNDFIIIDTPGNDNELSRLVHSYADIVLTPINDSFVDIDLLATVCPKTITVIKPSIYSQMIWEQKMNRAKRDNGSMDWIIMRNRITHQDTRNKRSIEAVVSELSKRLGCKTAPGFGDRVIFKELFLKGLTLLDVKNPSLDIQFSLTHIAARQELTSLLKNLNIIAPEKVKL